MTDQVRMEILFGKTTVLLTSPLPEGAERARCETGPDGLVRLTLDGVTLTDLTLPEIVRGRLDGFEELPLVEIENEAPVRKRTVPVVRVPA
jgi:hypothetical protein